MAGGREFGHHAGRERVGTEMRDAREFCQRHTRRAAGIGDLAVSQVETSGIGLQQTSRQREQLAAQGARRLPCRLAAHPGAARGPGAAAASLIETCKLNGVNPQTYFTDLLTRLVNGWPQAQIDELMPWCWKPSAPT
jgi:hypothetical protein